LFSLHPVTTEDVRIFLTESAAGASDNESIRRGSLGLASLSSGDSRGAGMVGHALATYLAEQRPCFVLTETCLTNWEATIDRGVGMLLRPPSRLLVDAGMDRGLAQHFPIRLDHNGGMMAGAYVPAHLVSQFEALLEQRLERELRRLIEAELDPVANMGLMLQALGFARREGTGLIEAMDVVEFLSPSTPVFAADRKRLPKELRTRLEAAARPPRKPGLMTRLLNPRSAETQLEARMREFQASEHVPDDESN
jgi:hypothetical protein